MNLQNKVVIVTGATSGIGLATVRLLLEDGAKVVAVGKNPAKAGVVPSDAFFVQADVREEDQIRSLVDQAVEKYGAIDSVVNAAGISYPDETDMLTFSKQKAEDTMSTNFMSIFLMTKYALPHLIRSKGAIVNIASILGFKILKDDAFIYCASKAAVISFTKSTAVNYAAAGVRANAICPGATDTPMLRGLFPNDEAYAAFAKTTPNGAIGKPEDVANTIVFLLSDKARHISGATIAVDGAESLV